MGALGFGALGLWLWGVARLKAGPPASAAAGPAEKSGASGARRGRRARAPRREATEAKLRASKGTLPSSLLERGGSLLQFLQGLLMACWGLAASFAIALVSLPGHSAQDQAGPSQMPQPRGACRRHGAQRRGALARDAGRRRRLQRCAARRSALLCRSALPGVAIGRAA